MNSIKTHPPVQETRKVDAVFHTLYEYVQTLEDWLTCLDTSGALKSILHADKEHEAVKGYAHLLTTTLVAERANSKKIRTPVSFEQVSHQRELLVRSVQRVLQRDGAGNNILSFGFGPMTDNPRASVADLPNLEYRYSNSSFTRLRYKVWDTLLSRIGDDLMSHLLENTSIFVLIVKPAVYLQITGEPIFQLWPYAAGSTYPVRKPLNCVSQMQSMCSSKQRGRKDSFKQKYLKKGKLLKISEKAHRTKISESECQTADQQSEHPAISGEDTVLDSCTEKMGEPSTQKRKAQSDSDFGSKSKMKKMDSELALKPKRRRECDNVSLEGKKQKKSGHETSQCTLSERCSDNPGSVVDVSCQNTIFSHQLQAGQKYIVSETSDDTAAISINSSSNSGTAPKSPVREKDDSCYDLNIDNKSITEERESSFQTSAKEIVVTNTARNHRGLHHQDLTESQCSHHGFTNGEAEMNESSIEVIAEEFADSNPASEKGTNVSSLKSKRQRKRMRKKRKAKLQRTCSSGVLPYKHHQYVPRLSLLYGKTFIQKFPKNFSLTRYSESDEGGKLLFNDIFVKGNVGGNLSSITQPCQCQQAASPVSVTLNRGVHNSAVVENSHTAFDGKHVVNSTQTETFGENENATTGNAQVETCSIKNGVMTEENSELEIHSRVEGMAQEEQSELETCRKNEEVVSNTADTLGRRIQDSSIMVEGHICSTRTEGNKNEGADHRNTIIVVEEHDEGMMSRKHVSWVKQTITDQKLVYFTEENVRRGSQQAAFPVGTGAQEQADVKNADCGEEQESGCSTGSSQHAVYDADVSSSTSSSIIPFGQTSCKNTLEKSISQPVKACESEQMCLSESPLDVDTDVSSSNPTSTFPSGQTSLKHKHEEPVSYSVKACEPEPEQVCPSESLLTVNTDLPSSDSSSVIPCGQTLQKHKHKGSVFSSVKASESEETFPTISPPAVASESSFSSPMEILVADTPPKTKSSAMSLQPTVSSPLDIIMAETSPGVKSSLASSSSAVVISDVSSSAGVIAHQLSIHEHSSFYSEGSSQDRMLANLNMTAFQTPKQPLSEVRSKQTHGCSVSHSVESTIQAPGELLSMNKDKQKSVGTAVTLSGYRDTPKQTETMELQAAHSERRVFLDHAVQQRSVKSMPSVPEEPAAQSVVPSVLSDLHNEVLPLLKLLLHNHGKCNHRALLEHYCQSKCDRKTAGKTFRETARKKFRSSEQPLDTVTSAGQENQHNAVYSRQETKHRLYKRSDRKAPSTPKLLEEYIPHCKVSAFVQAVVKQTVPEKLIGMGSNMTRLIKNIRTLISAGKFEKMHLGQLMMGMKVKDCIWLRKVLCPLEKQHRLAQLVWWIVACFVFAVIRAFFYLTDTCTFRTRLLYYRKSTWLKLQMRALNEFRKATSLQPISEARVTEMLSSGRSLGVSVLRFVPKTQSLRPIVNMSRKPKPASGQKLAINKQLKKLFQVLNFEKTLNASMCGCSAFGIDEVYKKLKQFKEYRSSVHDNRALYFVKTDVSKCFDSIKQDLLYSIVRFILTKDGEHRYMTRKYATVHLTGKKVKRVFHSDTAQLTHYQPDFGCFVRKLSKEGKLTDIILVDQAYFQENTTTSLLEVLSSHLFRNIIKMGRRHYLQNQGVSQGSVLSTLLASIYLSHLEATHLKTGHDELLVRWMDDYLFLTPHRSCAQHFLETSVKGFPDFNIFTNTEKHLTNFPAQLSAAISIKNTEQGDPFPWCGLMINTGSLEVSVDYSRYSGLCMTDTATFDSSFKPGQTMRMKLIRCMKIKCHAIFFDPSINSRERILVNAFQVMLFLVRIFHSFVTKLPASRRVESNPAFFNKTVDLIPGHLLSFVTRKLKQAKCGLDFPINLQTLQWLNADAFLLKLHQYPGYRPLKTSLRAKRQSVGRKLGKQEVSLLKAVHRTGMKLDSDIVLFP